VGEDNIINMESQSARTLVVDGVTSYGDQIVIILSAVVVVIVAFVVLRRGLAMLGLIDKNSGYSKYD